MANLPPANPRPDWDYGPFFPPDKKCSYHQRDSHTNAQCPGRPKAKPLGPGGAPKPDWDYGPFFPPDQKCSYHQREDHTNADCPGRPKKIQPEVVKPGQFKAVHNEWDINCKIWIGGLGEEGTRIELDDEFSKFGPVKNIWLAKNPPSYAFIEMEDPRDAEDAVKTLDGKEICGMRARVEMARDKEERKRRAQERQLREEMEKKKRRAESDRGRDRDYRSRDGFSRDRDRDGYSRDRDGYSRDRDRDGYSRDRDKYYKDRDGYTRDRDRDGHSKDRERSSHRDSKHRDDDRRYPGEGSSRGGRGGLYMDREMERGDRSQRRDGW